MNIKTTQAFTVKQMDCGTHENLYEQTSRNSIPRQLHFNSYEIKSDSIEIRGFKRVCKNQKCEINEVDKDFADQIKINILEKARKNNLKK